MFAYPKQAEFNRPVPKNKIYGYAKPSRVIRDRFVSQVSEIVWKYKLAPETVNLPAHRQGKLPVHEIQVFEIARVRERGKKERRNEPWHHDTIVAEPPPGVWPL